jgi:site-specific recombinase XerD
MFEVNNLLPATQEYRNAFNKANKDVLELESLNEAKEPNKTLIDVFDEFVKESGVQNDWTDATYEKFAAAKNHLINFDSTLTFESLTESKLTSYVNYLRDNKNMRNSTIGKQLGFLKWFLRWGKKKRYNNNIAFETFAPKLKTTQKKVIFLTWAELTALREYQIPVRGGY